MAGRIKSLKNSSDSIRNRTCDLPACSTVPQPSAPPHTPSKRCVIIYFQSSAWQTGRYHAINNFPTTLFNSSVDLTHNYVTNILKSNSLVLYQKLATLTYKKIHSSGVHNYFHISVPKYIPFSTTGHAGIFMYHILKEKPILE